MYFARTAAQYFIKHTWLHQPSTEMDTVDCTPLLNSIYLALHVNNYEAYLQQI